MEGVEHMGRGETGLPRTTALPPAIQQDPPFASETGEEIAPGKILPDHGVGIGRIRDTHMRDVVGLQGRAVRGTQDRLGRVRTDDMRLDERRMVHGRPDAPSEDLR